MAQPSYQHFPSYDELHRPDDGTGLPLVAGVWGAEDQLGTLNHADAEATRSAALLVRRGMRFNLDLPLHLPFGAMPPGTHRRRQAPEHVMYEGNLAHMPMRDDRLDGLFLQGSSQWDGLTHIGDPTHGFYNGVAPEQVTGREGTRNGIEHFARFALATRCVLADVPRWLAAQGRDWDPMAQQSLGADELTACLQAQGVALQPGDVLLVRLGWVSALRAAPDEAAREALFKPGTFSGLSGGEDMWRLLWDARVAAVATDTVTVEVWPPAEWKPSLHWAIGRLGITLGEMFDLDALAEDSAATGEYTAFLTSSPLNVRGGVGSPPNAIAIR